MAKKLLSPEQASAALRRRYQLHHREWLEGAGSWPSVVALGKPTERDVQADAGLVRSWIDAWRAFSEPTWLRWVDMEWPRVGTQRVPTHLEVPSAHALAELVGEGERFDRACRRHGRLVAQWRLAQKSALTGAFDVLAGYADADFERLVDLVTWLLAHPASGYRLRQLPIPGLHTKWVDTRRQALVADWLSVLRDEPKGASFHQSCGLLPPPVRVRMRVLCPQLRHATGGLDDVEAPVEQLARLALAPRRVLVIENLESGLALPELADTVAFLGLGNAVTLLSGLPWLASAQRIYWGDLDTHGFAILDRARASLGPLRSVLMDEATLLACRDLWGEEPTQAAGEPLSQLTASEREVFEGLRMGRWGQKVRLEQERIPWSRVLEALSAG